MKTRRVGFSKFKVSFSTQPNPTNPSVFLPSSLHPTTLQPMLTILSPGKPWTQAVCNLFTLAARSRMLADCLSRLPTLRTRPFPVLLLSLRACGIQFKIKYELNNYWGKPGTQAELHLWATFVFTAQV